MQVSMCVAGIVVFGKSPVAQYQYQSGKSGFKQNALFPPIGYTVTDSKACHLLMFCENSLV